MTDLQLWKRAGALATLAMGPIETRRYGREKDVKTDKWKADEDPLAWVCLTQSIFDLARAASKKIKR